MLLFSSGELDSRVLYTTVKKGLLAFLLLILCLLPDQEISFCARGILVPRVRFEQCAIVF